MVDRFNNSAAAPRHKPFDDASFFGFQGGNFAGIQDQLPYIKGLGAGAVWLSSVLKNVPFEEGTYHGYGIHHFLRADPRFAKDPGYLGSARSSNTEPVRRVIINPEERLPQLRQRRVGVRSTPHYLAQRSRIFDE